ncbi:MAG TPA: hypothetical protein VNR00_01250 [Opitutus sp.]|nr:hypothetical protein [Opitutus sp.]
MKNSLFVLGCCLALAWAGCSTVDSRLKKHESAFNSWPADVQQKVRSGQIDLGFTPEMVQVALGDPSRVFTRTTQNGNAEVWVYPEKGPKFSFGVGVGSMRGSTGVGGGVTVGDTWRDEEALRVVFEGGRVSAIERRR